MTPPGHPTWILSHRRSAGDGDAEPLHFRLEADKRRSWSSYIFRAGLGASFTGQSAVSANAANSLWERLPRALWGLSRLWSLCQDSTFPAASSRDRKQFSSRHSCRNRPLKASPVEILDEGVARRRAGPAEVQLHPVEVSPPVYALHRTPVDGDEHQFVQGDRSHIVFEGKDVGPGFTYGPVTGSVG